MKLYDKAYVQADKNDNADDFLFNESDVSVVKKENVIVMSINELAQLWDCAELGGFKEGKFGSSLDVNSFKTYLQSKGINI